jgi:TolB-like protein/predicted Zn-dependent protease
MDEADAKSLKRLFERAIALPVAERDAFLDEACSDNPEVQAELASLLAAADDADPFFASLANAALSLPPWPGDQALDAAWQADDIQADDEPDPLIGSSVRQYVIHEKLGRGGMGVVYRAYDTSLDRTVALKFLPPYLSADDSATERFLVEARAAASLDHPNVCNVHEIGESEKGERFIAMAYYEGETLKQKIERGPLPIDEALDYACQIGAGLDAAHEHGIIHRDIKPGNVIVTPDGTAKVLDFGLAKLADVSLTGTGVRLGTIGYMSPEHVRGESLDQRADLWSLGVVLYEMLTGQLPFKGRPTAVVVHSILHEQPMRPSALRDEIPPELEAILGRLLAKDPRRRPANSEILDCHVTAGAEASAETATVSRWSRLRSWRGVVGLGSLIVAAMATWWVTTQTGGAIPPVEDKSVAVLPFVSLGEEPGNDFFSAGVTSEIINHLARVGDLTVISRTSVKQYTDTEKPLQQIAQELGVATIVEGDVLQIGDRVRVNAQLIRAGTDRQLWADQYEARVTDVFEIQSEIAQRIAAALRATLSPAVLEEIERRPTDNLEAYGYYLRAADYDESGQLEAPNRESLALLERAIELDPEFADAWALLSEHHSRMYLYYWDRSPERLARAESTAREAVRLQPDLGQAHRALGFYYYWGLGDYESALEHFGTAVTRIPGDAMLHLGIAAVYRRQARWSESLASYERAVELNPGTSQYPFQLALTQSLVRNYPEANRNLDQALRLNPDDPYSYWQKTRVYVLWRGDTQAAGAALDTLYSRPGLGDALEGEGGYLRWWVLLLERRYWDALSFLNTSQVDRYENQFFVVPKAQLFAQLYGLMGQPDLAVAYFDSARVMIETALREAPDDPRLHSALGTAYAGLGRRDEAVREAELGVELQPVESDALKWLQRVDDLARVYATVGEYDAATDRLDYLLSHPAEISVPLLRLDPTWDPLRDHPDFQALLERYAPAE